MKTGLGLDQRSRAFLNLAVAKGYLSFEKARRCLDESAPGQDDLPEKLLSRQWITREQYEDLEREIQGGTAPAAANNLDDDRFCEECIRRGLLTIEQIHEALRKREGSSRSLDEVLLDLGHLTLTQIQNVRGKNAVRGLLSGPRHLGIGETAVRKGLINRRQLSECLAIQEAERRKFGRARMLGEILLDEGYIDAAQLQDLLGPPARVSGPPVSIPGYEILQRIAKGAEGEIFKARQLSIDRIVAIKILPLHGRGAAKRLETTIREARIMARLNHPNIVRAIDAGRVEGRYYIVMEFVKGTTLQRMIDVRVRLPERECLKVALALAHVLEYVELRKMVHRDIKPENIILTDEGEVKLIDLGLATRVETSSEPQTAGGLGTPYYASPEAITGHPLDVRSDIYSLGATLYHCATGVPPFVGQTVETTLAMHLHSRPIPPKELNTEISDAFNDALLRMLAKAPEERFQSAAELGRVLEEILMAGADPALTRKVDTELARRKSPDKRTSREGPGTRPLLLAVLLGLLFGALVVLLVSL